MELIRLRPERELPTAARVAAAVASLRSVAADPAQTHVLRQLAFNVAAKIEQLNDLSVEIRATEAIRAGWFDP
jgi:uncharacterized protein (UPF0147 family)